MAGNVTIVLNLGQPCATTGMVTQNNCCWELLKRLVSFFA